MVGSSLELDFIDSSSLEYLVPLATDLKLEEALGSAERNPGAFIESIERRETLFFDESVNVYLVLKTPPIEDDPQKLKTLSKRLVVFLEAQIANSSPADRDGQAASETIYSGTVDELGEPLIWAGEAVDDDEGDTPARHVVFLIWKVPVFLARPRMRLQGPSAVFTAAASLRISDVSISTGFEEGYLSSGVASGLNLLESFGNDPALNGIKPRLSALRVSRVAPVTQQAQDILRPIKSHPKQLSLRIYPAAHTRIRFARPSTIPPSPDIIAMLEIDFTPFFECEVALTSISLSVSDGVVDSLTSQPELALPMSCVRHDHVTFLYHVAPDEPDMVARNPTRDLSISIEAVALVEPGICTPKLVMAWTTTLDFTLPVNPGFGSAMQPIQRAHRPSQLSIGSMASLTAPAVARPDALPLLEAAPTGVEASLPELGITMTFTGPPSTEKIYPGSVFTWTVFVVNRAPSQSSAAPRKLALVAIPKRRRNESRVNRPPSVSHPQAPHIAPQQRLPRDRSVADAVMDENIVHAMQRNSTVDSVEMVCLSADVRIGPLAAGACHVVELRFMALNTGIVSVEAVRVIDLGSTEHVDIRELPTTLVEELEESNQGRSEVQERLQAAVIAN